MPGESLGNAVLELRTDSSGLDRGMRTAESSSQRGFNRMQQGADKLGRAIKAAFSITAIIAAGRAIIRTSDQVITAFGKQEEAERKLATAAANNPLLNAEAVGNLTQFAAELQGVTRIGDEVSIDLAAQAAAWGRSESEIRSLIGASADLSATLGIDLQTAARGVNNIFEGNITTLSRYIPELRNLTQEEIEAGAAMDLLNERFGGMAEAMAQGVTGAREQFQNIVGDLGEAIGGILGPLQERTLRALMPIIQRATDWINDHSNQILNFFINFPDVVKTSVSTAGDIIRRIFTADYLRTAVGAVWEYFKAQAQAILTFVWEYIKAWAQFVWQPVKTGFEWVAFGIRTAWQGVITAIVNLINILISPINALIEGLETIVNRAKDAGAAIRAFISHPFNRERRERAFAEIVASQNRAQFGGIGQVGLPQFEAPTRPEAINVEAMRDAIGDAWRSMVGLAEDVWENAKQLGGDLAAPFADITQEAAAQMAEILNRDLPEGMRLSAEELTMALEEGAEAIEEAVSFEDKPGFSLDQIAPGLSDSLVGFGEAVLGSMGSIESLAMVMDPLATIAGMLLQHLQPLIDQALDPVNTLFIHLAEILAQNLIPLFQVLIPIINLFADLLNSIAPLLKITGDLYSAMLPVLKAWLTPMAAVGAIFQWLINVIANFGDFLKTVAAHPLRPWTWAGGSRNTNLRSLIGSAVSSLWAGADLSAPAIPDTTQDIEDTTGGASMAAGATFRQQRPITVTVNVYDNQVFGGSLQEFAVMLRDEFLAIDELGL